MIGKKGENNVKKVSNWFILPFALFITTFLTAGLLLPTVQAGPASRADGQAGEAVPMWIYRFSILRSAF